MSNQRLCLVAFSNGVAADLYVYVFRHRETAKGMVAELGEDSSRETGLDVRGIVRLFGALQSNGFASGIYLHPAMTNHSCRYRA